MHGFPFLAPRSLLILIFHKFSLKSHWVSVTPHKNYHTVVIILKWDTESLFLERTNIFSLLFQKARNKKIFGMQNHNPIYFTGIEINGKFNDYHRFLFLHCSYLSLMSKNNFTEPLKCQVLCTAVRQVTWDCRWDVCTSF